MDTVYAIGALAAPGLDGLDTIAMHWFLEDAVYS